MAQQIPIPTLDLFPQLDALLIELLQSLQPEDWLKQTLSPAWKVKDVAAHLLDGNIRSLSSSRDGFFGEKENRVNHNYGLVTQLNQLNADWVKAMKRVSPEMLIALLTETNLLYSTHLRQLPPFEKALFPVTWAGETESQNWFHIAREYTEKWHHQQQIREAVDGGSPLFAKLFFTPFLETSLKGLPYHFRNLSAETGDTFSLIISGEGGGEWHFLYDAGVWRRSPEIPSYSVTTVHIDDRVIWRMFSNQISAAELKNRTMISGKKEFAEVFMQMRAVMV